MRALIALLLVTTALPVAAPAAAQDVQQLDRRVDTLESQMRAVQRRVFPGGDKRFFEPEIPAAAAPPAAPPPAATPNQPLIDLSSRVDALERSVKALTGQVETQGFRLKQMEDQLARFRNDAEFRLDRLENPAAGATTPATDAPTTTPAPPARPTAGRAPTGTTAPATKPADSKTSTKPATDAKGTTTKPAETADAKPALRGEALYEDGYARFERGDFDGAREALSAFVAANPKSPRASNAQFWLGRSLAAQGQHAQAAKAFLDGYQRFPKGERAPNSLLWLGRSLIQLKQPQQACRAFTELTQAYPAAITGRLKSELDKSRAEARCE